MCSPVTSEKCWSQCSFKSLAGWKRSAFLVENVWLMCIPVVPIIRKCKKSNSLKGATLNAWYLNQ